MSHVVRIQTKLHDPVAVSAACRRLNLPEPRTGTAQLFSGEATGLIVQLPGWHYPAVIDTRSGVVSYDNFNEAWGEQHHFLLFLQMYAVEKVKLTSRVKGYAVSEQTLGDGSIKLSLTLATDQVGTEYENGVQYDRAEELLVGDGFDEPFVHFSGAETPHFLVPAVRQYLSLPQRTEDPNNPVPLEEF